MLFAIIPELSGGFEGANDGQVLNSVQDPNQQNFLREAMEEDRAGMLRSDALRSFFFILIAAGALVASLFRKMSFMYAALLIGVLVTFDLWTVNRRYIDKENYQRKTLEQNFTATPADNTILKDQDIHYRVLNLQNPFNDAGTAFFHKSIGGYSPVKVRRYQDLIENNLGKEIQQVVGVLQSGQLGPQAFEPHDSH